MTQRKAWTAEEDAALKQLYEERGIKKWAEISRLLERDYHLPNRTGKQCRERYHNHLDSSIKHEKWSEMEECGLIELHNQLGNKWAEISRRIKGRSQNCIKNQFYSILRRGLRKINQLIRSHFRRRKEIEVNVLNKLVQCEGDGHPHSQLKQQIAHYAHRDSQQPTEEERIRISNLIQELKAVSKGTKKTRKTVNRMAFDQVQNEKESDDIDSEEYRDKYPVPQMLPELKLRRNSLYSFKLEKEAEQDHAERPVSPPPSMLPQFLRKPSRQSNEVFSPRLDVFSPKYPDIFSTEGSLQGLEGAFCSPRAALTIESPYFDQLRSYSNWPQYYTH